MRHEVVEQEHEVGDLEEHSEGADRGGHYEPVSGKVVLKTQVGTITYEYEYENHFNYLEGEDSSLDFETCLTGLVADKLQKFVDAYVEDEDDEEDVSFSLPSDEDAADELENRFEAWFDDEPAPALDEETVSRFLAFLDPGKPHKTKEGKVRVGFPGEESFSVNAMRADGLEDFVWDTEDFYYWCDSLAADERVQKRWSEVCGRVADEVKVLLEEEEAAARRAAVASEALRRFLGGLQDARLLTEEQVVSAWAGSCSEGG